MTPFADALGSARTPADLEQVVKLCDAYLAANPYAVRGGVGDLCALEHRTEARAARREAYRRLGVTAFVPGSFGCAPEAGCVVPTNSAKKKAKREAVALERRLRVFTALQAGPKTRAELVIGGLCAPGTLDIHLRPLVQEGCVLKTRRGLNVFYRLAETA